MRYILRAVFAIFAVLLFIYILIPNSDFPEPPPDAVQSLEPADSETPLRRAYFTDLTREQVREHYKNQLDIKGLNFLTLALIYPPEEAFTLIRDQTRSTHLVELALPLRESLYINEFIAQADKDAIIIDGRLFEQKITVRYVQSRLIVRVIIVLLIIFSSWFVLREYPDALKSLFQKRLQNDKT